MKYLKHVVLSIMLVLIVAVSLFNNRLISFADEQAYSPSTLKEGDILKSGDPFTFKFNETYDYCKSIPIRLYVDFNKNFYTTVISHDTGKINDFDNILNNIPTVNDQAFTQEKEGTLPYVEGQSVLWEYIGSGYLDGYCFTDAKFIGLVYEEPKFELFCDSTKMEPDEKVACQVAVEYSYVPGNIEFELSSDKFNIEDITTVDGWKRTDEEKFIFEAEDLIENQYEDSRVSVDVIEFNITPKDKEDIDVEDAVKISKVSWDDGITKKELDSNIVEPMKMGVETPEEEKIEIPQTGVESYILLGVLVLIAGISLYRRLQEKGLFRRL